MMTETRKTFDQMTETERQKVAEALWQRERPRCQSALVDDLLGRGDIEGFGIDDIEGMYPDTSDWSAERCREWLDDEGHDYPDDSNPWKLDRAELTEIWESDLGGAVNDDDTDDELREGVLDSVTAGDWGNIEDWRRAVSDYATAAEPYEWWEVGDWLCEKLADADEVVIRNGYGHWWGRCCTGQSVTLDGVIQRLGAEYAAWALDA
jgi:hypothetical protein